MSYLDRLKRKISGTAPECEATKVSKAPFVPFVAPIPEPSRQISAAAIDREAFEERAAVREFDGGFNRQDAERFALADLADDRIHCTDCANLRGRVCAQAAMLGAIHGYAPVQSIARRCEGFKPLPGAPDQRTGTERWPCLAGEPHGGTIH